MGRSIVDIGESALQSLLDAIHSKRPVIGLTHNFYRYPARFSPEFARASIEAFSNPGDLIVDPFMGGGTTLVEARLLGRPAIGLDVSELSVFIARVKATPLSHTDVEEVAAWVEATRSELNIRNVIPETESLENEYKRNLKGRTWPIRKAIEIALGRLAILKTARQRDFARCALLKTGQWALDCRKEIPSLAAFRARLVWNSRKMSEGALAFSSVARKADRQYASKPFRTLPLKYSAIGIECVRQVTDVGPPKLILTSPPYPGVHVLYHRWQIQGRRETPAPFWIANCLDGSGASYYTMGDRKQLGLKDYYNGIRDAFTSLSQISDANTIVIQLVAFSEPSWQLPRYLEAMQQAGFSELRLDGLPKAGDSRLWRDVPNRKWYAQQQGSTPSSREVVLVHKLTKGFNADEACEIHASAPTHLKA